jgi:hypothetical protein
MYRRRISDVLDIALSPVPVVDQLNITLDILKTGTYQMWVLDAAGSRVETRELNLNQGQNQTSLDASQYAAGMYRLIFVNNGFFASENFVVQK